MSQRTKLIAEIVRRIPAMAADCAVNNETLLTSMLNEHLGPEFNWVSSRLQEAENEAAMWRNRYRQVTANHD